MTGEAASSQPDAKTSPEAHRSKGITSEVLNGKRFISKAQAKKLAAFFYVTADLFI